MVESVQLQLGDIIDNTIPPSPGSIEHSLLQHISLLLEYHLSPPSTQDSLIAQSIDAVTSSTHSPSSLLLLHYASLPSTPSSLLSLFHRVLSLLPSIDPHLQSHFYHLLYRIGIASIPLPLLDSTNTSTSINTTPHPSLDYILFLSSQGLPFLDPLQDWFISHSSQWYTSPFTSPPPMETVFSPLFPSLPLPLQGTYPLPSPLLCPVPLPLPLYLYLSPPSHRTIPLYNWACD